MFREKKIKLLTYIIYYKLWLFQNASIENERGSEGRSGRYGVRHHTPPVHQSLCYEGIGCPRGLYHLHIKFRYMKMDKTPGYQNVIQNLDA